jgi:cullin-5
VQFDFYEISFLHFYFLDSFSFKILSAAAWPHPGDKIDVSLPAQIEDVLPEIEEFYKKKHSGRKLTWYHTVSNGQVRFIYIKTIYSPLFSQLTFTSKNGKYDLDVSTLQASVLFAWNHRPTNKLTFSELKLATNIPENELKKTLWSLISFAKLKQQLIFYEPHVESHQELNDISLFWINYDFTVIRAGKIQARGHINMIQRLQLNTEKGREEENEEIMFLRGERTKEAIVQIMKTRQRMNNAQLQTELIEILKNMFVPSKKLIKEMIEWLIDHRYMARSETNISEYVYVA